MLPNRRGPLIGDGAHRQSAPQDAHMVRATPHPAVWINAIGTAVPAHDIHHAFIDWARGQLPMRDAKVFDRMVDRSGIDHRWSVLPPTAAGGSPVSKDGFYPGGMMPPTSARMAAYGVHAPDLALTAVRNLGEVFDPAAITHLVVASCTGFTAPGLDQMIASGLGLRRDVERQLIGFMGCYAGVTALRAARHIVRSQPGATVLVISTELSTLHLQDAATLEPLLAMLQFSDGAAAALVSGHAGGLRLGDGISLALDDSADLIRWAIGDTGFAMHLSGEVPARLQAALSVPDVQASLGLDSGRTPPLMAVHAGGRSVLDAVQRALNLDDAALADSRATLEDFGNMSSATILFVLARMLARDATGDGLAIAFGPGLAAEAIRFSSC